MASEKTDNREAWLEACRNNPLRNEAKLNIRNGTIHYKIYGQDGNFIPMTCADTTSNRRFVAWVQLYDRYTISGAHDGK